MDEFKKYLAIELFLAGYLGVWHVVVPLMIMSRWGATNVVMYEILLAVTAFLAIPVLSLVVERMPRGCALRWGAMLIFSTGVLRCLAVQLSCPLWSLIVIDMFAVAAFAMLQPLLGVSPAETVNRECIEYAFRIRRIVMIVGRLLGPLLAGALIAVSSRQIAVMVGVLMGACVFVFAFWVPKGNRLAFTRALSMQGRLREMCLGVKLKVALPPERFLTTVDVTSNIAVAAVLPILIPALVLQHRWGSANVGPLMASFALGGIVALMLMKRATFARYTARTRFIFLWMMLSVALAGTSQATTFVAVAIGLAAIGAAMACISLVGLERRVVSIPAAGRIRVMGASLIIAQLASALSFALYGGILARFGIDGLWGLYAALFGGILLLSLSARDIWQFLGPVEDLHRKASRIDAAADTMIGIAIHLTNKLNDIDKPATIAGLPILVTYLLELSVPSTPRRPGSVV